MAGAIPAWRLEWFEGEALVWTPAEGRRQEAAVGLRHGDKEKPSAIEVRVCAVDTRDGREVDQGQVPYRLERGVGWADFVATRHYLPEAVTSCAREGRGFGSAMAEERLPGNQENCQKTKHGCLFRRRRAHPVRSS